MERTSLSIDSTIITEFQEHNGTLANFANGFMERSVELASYYQGFETCFVSNFMGELGMVVKLLKNIEIGSESDSVGIHRLTEEEREVFLNLLKKVTS